MENFSDWLIVGSLTLVVGATASFAIPGGASGALLGSTTGAVLGAAISSKRQDDQQRETVTRLKELETQVVQQDRWQNIQAELPTLTERVNELRKAQTNLATVEGQFVQKQAELQQLEQRLTTINQQNQDLERRIAAINQQQPSLSNLEKVQLQTEQFRLNKSGLEGQINALLSQIESLEAQKRSLIHIESEFATKKNTIRVT